MLGQEIDKKTYAMGKIPIGGKDRPQEALFRLPIRQNFNDAPIGERLFGRPARRTGYADTGGGCADGSNGNK